MSRAVLTLFLLVVSNVFMTFAWFGNLKFKDVEGIKGWLMIILVSWGVALLEYICLIPATRIGSTETGGPFSLMQFKVIQEVISLTVFTLVVMRLFQGVELGWNHIAAFCCLAFAVFFIFWK